MNEYKDLILNLSTTLFEESDERSTQEIKEEVRLLKANNVEMESSYTDDKLKLKDLEEDLETKQ